MYVNFYFMYSDVMISTEWPKSRTIVKIHNERNIPAIDLIIFPMRAAKTHLLPETMTGVEHKCT